MAASIKADTAQLRKPALDVSASPSSDAPQAPPQAPGEPPKPKPTLRVAGNRPQPQPAQASGIEAQEPSQRKPLSISPQEAQEIAKEVPAHGMAADLTHQDQGTTVSSAFTSRSAAKEPTITKKSLPFLIGLGAAGLVVVILLAVGVFMIFGMLGSEDTNHAPTPVKRPNAKVEKNDEPDQPEVKSFVGQWAWKHTSSFEQSFKNQYLFKGKLDTPFTMEFWLKIEKLGGIDEVVLTTAGDKASLGVKKTRSKFIAFFDVPGTQIARVPTAPFPTGDGWVHLAGVYDPNRKVMGLFVNGLLAKTKRFSKVPLLTPSVFILRGEIHKGSAVILDGVRLSEGVLYRSDFKPERNFTKSSSTVSLLHMEKNPDGVVMDYAQDMKKLYFKRIGEWVKVDTVNFKIAHDESAELERELMASMEKKLGKKKFASFKKAWAASSAADKQSFLDRFKEEKNGTGKKAAPEKKVAPEEPAHPQK